MSINQLNNVESRVWNNDIKSFFINSKQIIEPVLDLLYIKDDYLTIAQTAKGSYIITATFRLENAIGTENQRALFANFPSSFVHINFRDALFTLYGRDESVDTGDADGFYGFSVEDNAMYLYQPGTGISTDVLLSINCEIFVI